LRHLTTLGGPAIIDYPKGHFCTFMGWEGLKARILDPPNESELISLGDLRKRWGYHVICFSKPEKAK
jgi:ABC-type bacteriocin/lantibiotic exporter with double-glycine peptidase domain